MLHIPRGRGRIFKGVSALLVVLMAVTGLSAPSDAQDNIAQEAPLTNQPRVLDGRIYGIDSYGSTIVVGGTFTTIKDASNASIAQSYVFKFDTNTGLVDMNFLPQISDEVDSVQISADGQHVYIGGAFSQVEGVTRRKVAKLNLSDGSLVTQFKANASTRVYDLRLDDDKLFVAGKFATINGQSADRLAAVDLVTGDLLPQFSVDVTGTRNPAFPGFIQEMDLSPDGRWIVISGSFTSVGGQDRQQIAVVEVTANSAFVSNWFTDRYEPICGRVRSGYIRDVAIDPSSSYFVVNTTAYHRGVDLMCDTAARWDLPSIQPAGGDMEPRWATYTGGDTHWAAGVTDSAVYVGGHQRWENNPYPSPRGDNDGPGAVERFGIAALDPLTGVPLSWNPTRHRGRGVEAIHFNDDFMFVGSDTDFFNNTRIERLAVLPFDAGATNPPPIPVTLPASLHAITGATVDQIPFNGTTFGSATTISGPFIDGVNWCTSEAAFAVNDQVISFDEDDAYYRVDFDGARFGSSLNLSTTVGYVNEENETPYDQPRGVAETTNAAYHEGRIFYTKQGSTDLFWRFHGLESGIIGGQEFTASTARNWSNTTGLAVMGGQLYAATTANQLVRYNLDEGSVSGGTVVDSGAAGIDWDSVTDLFAATPPTTSPLVGSPTTCNGGVFPTPPSTTVTAPDAGELSGSSIVDLAGTATDNAAVSEVGVSIRNVDTGLFLQPNGTFGTTSTGLPANLSGGGQVCSTTLEAENGTLSGALFSVSDPSASGGGYISSTDSGRFVDFSTADSATYSFSTPTSANYTLNTLVQGVDGSGNSFWVRIDNGPAWLWDTATDAGFVSDQVNDRTSAADPVVVNLAAGNHTLVVAMREDGTRLDRINVTQQGCSPGSPTTDWSLQVTLPDGNYEAVARAVDDAGDVDPAGASTTFTVDTTAPSTTIDTPVNNSTLTTGTLDVTGTAVDAIGVDRMRVSISDTGTDLFLQADGSFAAARVWFDATLDNPAATSTGWSLPITVPDGDYRVIAKADDTAGNVEAAVRSNFSVEQVVVGPDPTTTITSATTFAAGAYTMTGTATDDTGVVDVSVVIRSRDNQLYVQADGTLGATRHVFDATLVNPGAPTSDWSVAVNVPDPGRYRLIAWASDLDGNVQAPTTSTNAVVN